MSADLFAAFGQPGESTTGGNSSTTAKAGTSLTGINVHDQEKQGPWILQSQPIPQRQEHELGTQLWKEDGEGTQVLFDASDHEQTDDDFGDFEDASSQIKNQELPVSSVSKHDPTDLLGLDEFQNIRISQVNDPLPDFRQHESNAVDLLGMIGNERSDWESHGSHQLESSTAQHDLSASQVTPNISLSKKPESSAGDDEWGDFEGAESEAAKQAGPEPVPTTPGTKFSTARTTTNDEDEDDWDAFEDGPSTIVSLPPHQSMSARTRQISTPVLPSTMTTATITPAATSTTLDPATRPRPTNVPPPSMLLQLLPQIYTTLSTQARNPGPDSDVSEIARRTLQSYIVSARLIAGRSIRWKRDTLLSQSTRISQAGLKNTGMKLTALDKSSTIKEDQDVQEAISAWQRHAATLNATMLKARLSRPAISLSQNMAARTVTGPGVLTARECCAVCGIKRNERVTGIDVKVDDTFGEFWVEHWGHKDCFEFWYMYENLLSRR